MIMTMVVMMTTLLRCMCVCVMMGHLLHWRRAFYWHTADSFEVDQLVCVFWIFVPKFTEKIHMIEIGSLIVY